MMVMAWFGIVVLALIVAIVVLLVLLWLYDLYIFKRIGLW